MDIQTIIANHNPKNPVPDSFGHNKKIDSEMPSVSEIPDLFFDEVLPSIKLSRIDIMVLLYLYRVVWCRPNLYSKYGIGPLISLEQLTTVLKVSLDELYHSINKLESLFFIETIRIGQYFVRKYFTKENDAKYGINYDDFFKD
jgi:hypothetical protein